jgi:chromosomal replication initiation ATPase DnaA
MPRQLAFDLPVRAALGRDDFFVSPANAGALAMIDAPQGWPQGKLLLIGPRGSGKSHLAEVFAHDRQAMILTGADLFELAEPPDAVIVEDAESVAGRHEELLFHLHNRMAARDGLLLLTASAPPGQWGLRLPDLLSRMQATAVARLEPPDDALLGAVIVKLFADRQVQVPPTLIPFLVGRIDRSFAAAQAMVAALDARALAQGRPVTRAMAGELLDSGPVRAP